ncbi:MAG: DUF2341 domain-containing protein [Methanobacteriota archaeon]
MILSAQGKDDVALDWAWLSTDETGQWRNFSGLHGWQYCKRITIHHESVAGDLVNFPILVLCTSSDFVLHAQADGDDFVFTDTTATVRYDHEIDSYNSATGELVAWVEIPELSSTDDTTLLLCYGNPTCTSQKNVVGTWSNGFSMVQHLTGATYTELKDSTGNHWDITSMGGNPVYNQVGKIGTCVDFDGNGDWLQASGFRLSSDSSYTGSAWIYVDGSNNTDRGVFCGDTDYPDGPAIRLHIFANNSVVTYVRTEQGTQGAYALYSTSNTKVYSTSPRWFYVTTRLDTNTDDFALFVNAAMENSCQISGVVPSENMGLNIGTRYNPNTDWMNGRIDEVRISNIARSTAWIQTEYMNMVSPSSFITVSTEQSLPSPGIYGSPKKMQENSLWQWSNFTWINPGLPEGTRVGWRITYQDLEGYQQSTPIMSFMIGVTSNDGPVTPVMPEGPHLGTVGVASTFSTVATDPDSDNVQYGWDWNGDDMVDEWSLFSESGVTVTASYSWVGEGHYNVKVKARDGYGVESGWSTPATIVITPSSSNTLVIEAPSLVNENTFFTVTITLAGAPVSNALVEFGGSQSYTNSSGMVMLRAPFVDSSSVYPLTVSHSGYNDSFVTLTVLDQGEQGEKGWIFGWVTNTDGVAVRDVRICIILSTVGGVVTSKCVLTNQDGSYNLSAAPGTYTVKAGKSGYRVTSRQVVFEKNTAQDVSFVLEKTQGVGESDSEMLLTDLAIDEMVQGGNVVGEITVNLQQSSEEELGIMAYYDGVSFAIESVSSKDFTFNFSGPSAFDGRVIIVRFGPGTLDDMKNISILYDNESIERVDFDVFFQSIQLEPGPDAEPMYTVVLASDAQGNPILYCLLQVYFSSHTVTIFSMVETVGQVMIIVSYILVCAVALLVFFGPLVARFLRRVYFSK